MRFRVHNARDVGATVEEAKDKCRNPILEPKYDGWRCVIIRTVDRVSIYNRSQKDYTDQLPELRDELMRLPAYTILDGELVALRFDVMSGRVENDFYRLHTVMRSKHDRIRPEQRVGITLVAFDCLQHPEEDVPTYRGPLQQRRAAIEGLIQAYDLRLVQLTLQMEATQVNHDQLVSMGFEGSVIKDQDAGYAFGKRGHGWYKIKSTVSIDGVVMEVLMDGKGQHTGKAGRMVIGQYRACTEGSSGTRLVERCKVNCPNDKDRNAMTGDPQAFIGRAVEIKVYGWSDDGNPRHPTFVRWRDDKAAQDCVWSEV